MKSLLAISTKINLLCDKVDSAVADLSTYAEQITDYTEQRDRAEATAKTISKMIVEERKSWNRDIQLAKKFTKQLDKLLCTVKAPPPTKKKRKKSKKVKKALIIPIVRCAIDALESRSGANDE